jgi:hypothetical protein
MKKIFFLALLAVLGCGPKPPAQDPLLAAKAAQPFVNSAFLCFNPMQAYYYTSPQFRAACPLEKFKSDLKRLHPLAHPDEARIFAYEALTWTAGLNLYVNAQHDAEKFYYRINMSGSKDAGYQVAGVFRGLGAYHLSGKAGFFESHFEVLRNCP